MVDQLRQRGITDELLLQAMEDLPRQWFCEETLLDRLLYDIDHAIRIDCGQTISKPYTVAWQTQLLQLKPGMSVLEIGTGSGYQAAVLCKMGMRVVTIERQTALYQKTKALLASLGYTAQCFLGDSFDGLPQMADYCFDRILVTCGAPGIPPGLMRQLKVGGLMVIPIGETVHRGSHRSKEKEAIQKMTRVRKEGDGPDLWKIEELGDASFVPMLGGVE